ARPPACRVKPIDECLEHSMPRGFRIPAARWNFALGLFSLALLAMNTSCTSENKPPEPPTPASAPADKNAAPRSATGASASDIMTRFFALDTARDSELKMKVKISSTGGATDAGTPGQVEVSMFNKRTSEGGRLMFIEFLSPAQERDRDSLITISPR